MNKDLYKRLEEAADLNWEKNLLRGAKDLNEEDLRMCARSCFILGGEWMFKEGAEFGYKEAIAQAKEWLKEHESKDWWEGYGLPFSLSDFENDMNKLFGGE